jgi:hypothetical protein
MDIIISTRHLVLLRRYSAKAGVSVDQCVHDALTEWFRKGGPATVTQLRLPHSTHMRSDHTLAAPSGVAFGDPVKGGIVGKIRSLLGYKNS